MVRAKLNTPSGRKFLLALLVVFSIAVACVGRATIVGVIEQYNIPLSSWTTSMFVLQSAMILVYSTVFTVLLAIPLGIFSSVAVINNKPRTVIRQTSPRAGFLHLKNVPDELTIPGRVFTSHHFGLFTLVSGVVFWRGHHPGKLGAGYTFQIGALKPLVTLAYLLHRLPELVSP